MGKKIIIITGSPRRQGNTVTVAGWVAEGARRKGAEVELVDACRLSAKVPGCCACMGCKQETEYRCVIPDEVANLVNRLPEYDAIVLASPVYFFSWSAQLKIVIDRMYSLFRFEADQELTSLRNVQLAAVATAGGTMQDGLDLLDKSLDKITAIIGIPAKHFYVTNSPQDPQDLLPRYELMEKAMAFGAELAG